MSVNVYDPVNDTLIPIAGATLFADTPVGFIGAFDAEEVPAGWLIFNGQTVLRSDYPDLWARASRNNQVGVGKFYGIGDGSTNFTLADLRETSLKGYGETSRSVGAHVKSGGLGIGEFIDDRIQNFQFNMSPEGPAANSLVYGTDTSGYSDLDSIKRAGTRTGPTTEVKAVGVVWAVKARMTGLPIDLKEQVENMMKPVDFTITPENGFILSQITCSKIGYVVSFSFVATAPSDKSKGLGIASGFPEPTEMLVCGTSSEGYANLRPTGVVETDSLWHAGDGTRVTLTYISKH